jgi:hypothetical protein
MYPPPHVYILLLTHYAETASQLPHIYSDISTQGPHIHDFFKDVHASHLTEELIEELTEDLIEE